MPAGPSLQRPSHRAVVAPADDMCAVVAELHPGVRSRVAHHRALRVHDEFLTPVLLRALAAALAGVSHREHLQGNASSL